MLAARLSEDPSISVLLLEAGPEETFDTNIAVPIAAIQLQKTPVDWCFETEAHHATDGRVHVWPRGKVYVLAPFFTISLHQSCLTFVTHSMGGCSSLNWMLYVRGNPAGTVSFFFPKSPWLALPLGRSGRNDLSIVITT